MNIIINKEKINYNLEGNENCGSIINDLREWLLQKKHIMLKIIVNDEEYNSQKHDNLTLEASKKIEIDTEHIEILTLNSLSELKNYAERVEDNINKISAYPSKFDDNKIVELFIQMKDGYSWCIKATDNISRVLQISVDNIEFFNNFNALKTQLNSIEAVFDSILIRDYITNGTIEKINLLLCKVITVLFSELKAKKTLLSFEEILDKATDLEKKLLPLKEELIGISEKLQIGESVEAMNLLKDKFSFLESITQFYHQTQCSVGMDFSAINISGKPLQESLDNYLKLLKELLDAFETRDYVMLADLIEYELTEFINIFSESIKQIESKVINLKSSSNEAGSVSN